MTEKLSISVVKRAEVREKRYTIMDENVRGFGLRVYPSGQKTWIFEYKGEGGGRGAPTKRITIGKAALKAGEKTSDRGDAVMPPDKARTIAKKYHARVLLGEDPQQEKMDERAADRVSDLIPDFLEKHVATKRKPKTHAQYEDVLNRIVAPSIGKLRAKDVRRADVSKMHLKWKSTPYQANRAVAVVGSLFTWAEKEGRVPEGLNPAKGIERFEEQSRERLLSAEECMRLGDAIRLAETDGLPSPDGTGKRQTPIGEHVAAALRLYLFTGCRVSEVLQLRWEHVDLERGMLFLPDSKTGKKAVVLNNPAMQVLSDLTHIGVYVIAGETAGKKNEKPRADLKKPWAAIRKHSELDDVRLHDLRHNFASFGAGGGLGLPVIGRLLGHKSTITTQKYAHLDNDPLRKATNTIGTSIAAAIGEGRSSDKDNQSGEVVEYPGKARGN